MDEEQEGASARALSRSLQVGRLRRDEAIQADQENLGDLWRGRIYLGLFACLRYL